MIWLLACREPPPPSTAELVAGALAQQDPEICLGVAEPLARGECQLAAGAPCEQIEPGLFQFECRFAMAETLQDEDEAVALCAQAGPYAGDCWSHLFQDFENRELARAPGFDEALASAEARVQRYAELGASDWKPPWGWLWRRLFEEEPVVDLAACEPYLEEDLRRCQRGATSILLLSWRAELGRSPRQWCGLSFRELHESASARPGLAWARHPALDEKVLEALESCPAEGAPR